MSDGEQLQQHLQTLFEIQHEIQQLSLRHEQLTSQLPHKKSHVTTRYYLDLAAQQVDKSLLEHVRSRKPK